MPEILLRVQSASAHNRIRGADRYCCAVGHPYAVFIIFRQKRIRKDAEDVRSICCPVFVRELCRDLDIEVLQETPLPARFPRLTEAMPNLFAIGAVFVLKKK